MGQLIVIEFTTLDAKVSDPDGGDGTPTGGWAFRHGPEAVAGDKFRLGATLDEGALLLGRRTWEKFARLWPTRDDEFSRRMNAVPKLVVTGGDRDLSAWEHSSRLGGDLLDGVRRELADRDLIVAGSTSVVRAVAAADLVDEYRLLTFPTVVGDGAPLFEAGRPVRLTCTSATQAGPAVLATYRVDR